MSDYFVNKGIFEIGLIKKLSTMKLLMPVFLFLLTQTSLGQISPNSITKEQALEDLKVFETSLKEIHPDIYRYSSRSEFDKAFERVRDSLTKTITPRQFHNLIAPLVAMVHCGHTFTITSITDYKRGLLPLDVKILNGKVFILRNFSSSEELRPGSEITEINGFSANELLQDFRSKSIADGYGITFKDRTIEKDFKWKFALFIGQPDSFKITFKENKNQEPEKITIAALSDELINQKLTSANVTSEKPLSFYFDKENNVAVIKLRSFMTEELKPVIKKSFREIRRSKIENVIIDIRWNTGGKAYAPPLLFSYLTDKSFKFKRKIVFRHGYKFSYPEFLNRNKFYDWVNKKLDRKINDSTFEWTHHRNTRKTYKPNKNAFLGNLYIVTNGMTASAGTEFASLSNANGRGIFVGEETGGDYNGVNGFDRTYLMLPNSKIGILIAGWRGIMAWDETKNIGHGVIPNYEVIPTIEDLLTGQDTEMKFTYQLIKEN
jgi:C-terminal processing protease CtpA/Prc